MKHIDKSIICYIGIILITSILYIYFGTNLSEPKVENFQEGLNPIAPIKKKIDGIIKSIQKQFTSIKTKIDSVQNTITNKVDGVTNSITTKVDGVKNSITNTVDNVEKTITGAIGTVTKKVDGIIKKADDVLINATRTLSKRARMMFNATQDLGDALKSEFENLGKAVKIGAEDVGQLFSIILSKLFPYLKLFFTESVGSRAECAWKKFVDIPHCSKYYVWNAFTSALYGIFILFPAGVIKVTTKLDALKLVKKIQDGIACVDKYIHSFLGFYILRWSDKIRDRCFRCTDLKPMPEFPMKDFKNHAQKMKQTYKQKIPDLLKEPVGKFKKSGVKFKSVFDAKASG